jgi:cell division protein FtsL
MESSEMGSEVKDRSRRTKIGSLLIVGLIIGVVAGYGVGFIVYQPQISQLQSDFSETQSTLSRSQSEVESLRGQLTEMQYRIVSLTSDLTEAQDTITSLETQLTESQSEVEALKASQLHKVNVHWADHERFEPYVSIQGSIFNSGLESAYNTILTVRIFDIVSTLLKSEEIHLGTIAGKSYIAFDVDITYSGDADSVTTTLTYD